MPKSLFVFLCLYVNVIHAKYHLRISRTSPLRLAELRSDNCDKHEQMYSCYTTCLQDPCCLAVKFSEDEQCETSYVPTETMDLVKVVSITS